MKVLKEGNYCVSIINQTFTNENGDDFSDLILDFSPFQKIAIDYFYDLVCLVSSKEGFIFIKLPLTKNSEIIKAKDVLLKNIYS